MSTSPAFASVARAEGVTFVTADGTDLKTLFTPGAGGSRIEGINITSNDTALMTMTFYVSDAGADYVLGTVAIPIGSGYTTVVPIQPLIALLPPSLDALILPSNRTLKAAMFAAVTAAKTVAVLVFGADF